MTRRTSLALAALLASAFAAPSAALDPAAAVHSVREIAGTPVAFTQVTASELPEAMRAGLPVAAGPERPLIVYCGGTGFTRAVFGEWVAAALLPYGDVVMWDYPGQGGSGGSPDPFTAERVVSGLAGWIDANAGDRPVVVWGHSLGGFVGAQLAARSDSVDAVVLEATAPDPVEALETFGPIPEELRPLSSLLDRYNIPATLRGFEGEVVILGAARDRVLPVELSRSMAEQMPDAVYVENPQASHHDSLHQVGTRDAVGELMAGLGAEVR